MAVPMIAASAIDGLLKNPKTLIVIAIFVIAVILIIVFGVYRPILCKIGLMKCSDDYKADKLYRKLAKDKSFNPNYWSATKITVDHDLAKKMADDVEGALGWNDKEEEIYGVLQQAGSGHNLSLVTYYYKIRHGVSMGDRVLDQLREEEELKRIQNIINSY